MGLSALLGEEAQTLAGGAPDARLVPIERLRPSPLQPRRAFDEDELAALALSIEEKGVLQPLLVRRAAAADPGFEIVAGERRWRAAQRAGLHELPVVVRDLADQEVIEVALIENLQRADLNALEEAAAYRRLMDEFSHTQEAIARVLGRSRSHVANTLRLLGLPEEVQDLLRVGALSAGHARALHGRPDAVRLARQVVTRELSVRETEALAARNERKPKDGRGAQRAVDPDIQAVERQLGQALGLAVAIRPRRGGGTLTIRYSRAEQLEAVIERLSFGG
jgi:ParB family chromosome partitioning protein